MKMRHGMPIWAPDDQELAIIQRQVSVERSKAARTVFKAIWKWLRTPIGPIEPVHSPMQKTPFYY